MSPRQMRYQAALRPDCWDTYGNRGFEATPQISEFRTNRKFNVKLHGSWGNAPSKAPRQFPDSFMEIHRLQLKAKDVGLLYYIESEGQNAVKIGFANDLGMRLAGLQTGNPCKLRVRWTQRATREVEAALHAYLKPFRINREWYPDDGLTCMVTDELGYALLDKVEADCVDNGADYEEAYEAAYLTLADVRRVMPDLVKEHEAWIAAGRPEDPQYTADMAKLDAIDASEAAQH